MQEWTSSGDLAAKLLHDQGPRSPRRLSFVGRVCLYRTLGRGEQRGKKAGGRG